MEIKGHEDCSLLSFYRDWQNNFSIKPFSGEAKGKIASQSLSRAKAKGSQ